MRYLTFAAMALTLTSLVVAAPAEAQGPRLGIAAGANVPTSTLDETHDTQFHGVVSLNARSRGTPFGFRAEGAWYQFGGEGDLRNLRSIGVTGNVTVDLPGQAIRPYLIAGAGYYNTKPEGLDATSSLGFNGGVGLRFPLTGATSAYLEGRLHHVIDGIQRGGEDRNAQFVPISFGIVF